MRKLGEPLSKKLGEVAGNLGLKPNHITLLGLVASLMVPVLTYYRGAWWGLSLILLSGFLDFLDGAVAKATGKQTRLGAFLDSVSDRVSDLLFILGLMVLNLNELILFLFAITSFLISYARARAEALGVRMEGVGIMERGERLILVATIYAVAGFSYLKVAEYLVIAAIALNSLTILQRVVHVWRALTR